MDQGLKERLIGAAVLVALAVWLIPWLLDGPDKDAAPPETALQLPVPARTASELKTEVIDLEAPSAPPSPAVAHSNESDRSAGQGAQAPQLTERAREAKPGDEATPEAVQARTESDPAASSGPAEAGDATGVRADVSSSARKTRHSADSTSAEAQTAAAQAKRPAVSESAKPDSKSAAASSPATASASGAKPAAELADTAPNGGWSVQLGSFGEQENAQRLADRLAAYGASPQISEYKADRRMMYRVRVGPYASRAKAEAAASSLGVHGFVAQVVTVR